MHTPLLLVGAGPLGLELAVALSRAGLDYHHVEAHQIGSTMQWWPHGTRWFSSNERIAIAGVPLVSPTQEKTSREEYLAYLRAVVEQFRLRVHTYTTVTGITRVPAGGFSVTTRPTLFPAGTAPDTTLHADKIILATGGTAAPNLLHIPGEDLPHVSHYFHDPHTYFQKNLLIVGGRNSAVEAALRCHRAGANVHFSYRGPGIDQKDIKYWLYPEFSGLLKSGAITPHFNTCPAHITPTHVTLAPATPSAPPVPECLSVSVPSDFVLLLTGYSADMSLFRAAGVALTHPHLQPAFNPDTMETNVPGLYVAGTAIAGTQGGRLEGAAGSRQGYKVFLENCHIHVPRIVHHLTGRPPPAAQAPVLERPES
jgi:thioredoxin reductase (NADPH)